MAAPIAKIEPETIQKTVNFLEEIKSTLVDFNEQYEEKKDEGD